MENFTSDNFPEMDAVFLGLFITVKIEVIWYYNRPQGVVKSVTALFYHEFFSLTPPCERSWYSMTLIFTVMNSSEKTVSISG